MADGLIFEVTEDQLTSTVMSLETALTDASLGVWLTAVADPHFKSQILQNFTSEGNSKGPWAPLAESTVESRIAEGYPGENPILIRTGEMLSYLTGTPGVVHEEGDALQLDIPGSPADQKLATRVAVHQKGSDKNKTPARPFLEVKASDAVTMLETLSLHIIQAMRGDII